MNLIDWISEFFLQLLIWVNGVQQNVHRNLKFVAGSGVTLTASEDVPNDANTITISAAGGGGSPAGANKDVQINVAGAFGADTSNFTYDATNHLLVVTNGAVANTLAGASAGAVFGTGHNVSATYPTCSGFENVVSGLSAVALGAGCTAAGASSVAIGQSCNAGTTYAQACGVSCDSSGVVAFTLGDTCSATTEGAMARGLQATASRWFEDVHSSGSDGAGVFTGHRAFDLYFSGGTAANMLQGDTTEIALDTNKTYAITAQIVGRPGTSPATGSVREKHEFLVDTTGGTATLLDDNKITSAGHDLASQSVALSISCPTGLTLRFNLDPSASLESWHFGARVTLSEIS